MGKTLMKASSRRLKSQKGSAWVETALVILPFLTLLFGVMDVSYAVFLRSCLLNAAREGTRYALTYHSDAEIKSLVTTYSMGFLDNTNQNLINVNYYPCSPTAGCSSTAATSGGNSPGNIVEVSIQNFPFSWLSPLTGLASAPGNIRPVAFNFTVMSTDVMGGAPSTGIPAR